MSPTAEYCMREWHAGFVDGLAAAVFFLLFVIACFLAAILAEAGRRP
jgi:hypothetical protein